MFFRKKLYNYIGKEIEKEIQYKMELEERAKINPSPEYTEWITLTRGRISALELLKQNMMLGKI